jgi:GxxExxY protein
MDIHKILGKGLLEIVYKDALEFELKTHGILYEREKKYEVHYEGITLKHHFFADFVIDNKIIIEIKSQQGVAEDHYKQTLNYLGISKCKLGLIINFGNDSLQQKRIVL